MGVLKPPRITVAALAALTPSEKEVLYVHDATPPYYAGGDGVTLGGFPIGRNAIPAGGTTSQVLAKINATDYNTQWVTPSGGGGSSNDDYNNIFLLGL
jgi:hypothetical protein